MPDLSPRRRILVLAICCMSLLIVGLDNTILNVALPTMQREPHTTVSGMQWTIDAYTLVLASLLMLSGSTADRIGRRRVFMAGLIVFTLGSLLCSLAPSGATVIAVSVFAALGGFLFVNTLYLQNVRGLNALHAGLYMVPMAAVTLVVAPLSGRLVASRGPRPSLLIAGVTMAASGLVFSAFRGEPSTPLLFTGYVLVGLGFGMVNSPITNTAVSGMPRSQAGVAAAVASTSRQTGQTLGVAVIGAVLAGGLSGAAPGGYADAFPDAARPAWWIITGCGLAVLLMGAATSGRRARESARRTAERLETEVVGAGVS
ncbi:MFS transporter [Streptomyces sp. NPDC059994]|uniref:MFS transporter n=1 Tax=Streptomyces sp. NPDC059994 TaxID=3347029 RepID=UPI00368A6688